MILPVEPVSLSSGAAAPAGPVQRRVVSEDDVARFETAMTNPVGHSQPIEIRSPEAVAPQQSIGKVLLNMVQEVRESQAGHMDRIQDVTAAPGESQAMEMRDLFSLQFELMQLTLQQDLTAKVADRLSQGVQTLFRNQ
ncbi:MAG: type III secretion system inner rod subunit SctI [Candidatus Hydrogenedentes bacterium]|nr:type III secretion system inner rod subunit SctI [Candidatus Hydrogenedentota bacterium]